MGHASIFLSDMSTSYFNDIFFIGCDYAMDLKLQVKGSFDHCYSLNYLSSGQLFFETPQASFRLTAPSLYWTIKGVEYHYGRANEAQWDNLWVQFNGPRADRYEATDLLSSGKLWRTPANPAKMKGQFERLLDLVKNGNSSHQAERVILLESILADDRSERDAQATGDAPQNKVRQIAESIEQDPFEKWNWHNVAIEAGMSHTHFRRVFKETLNDSPHNFLLEVRMRRIAALLKDDTVSISRAAEITGYDCPFYFSRIFKSKIGLSPKQYQQSVRLLQKR